MIRLMLTNLSTWWQKEAVFSSHGRHGQKDGVACGAGTLHPCGGPVRAGKRGCKFDMSDETQASVCCCSQPVKLESGQMGSLLGPRGEVPEEGG